MSEDLRDGLEGQGMVFILLCWKNHGESEGDGGADGEEGSEGVVVCNFCYSSYLSLVGF